MSNSLRGLAQRVRSLDDWCYFVRLDQLFQDDQVVRPDSRHEEGHLLTCEPGRHGQPEQMRQQANPSTVGSRSDRDEYPTGGHDAPVSRQRMVPDAIEDHVISLGAPGEIVGRVVHDMVAADGPNAVHIPRAAYTGHFSAERSSDPHRELAHTARRTVDPDLLPRLNLAFVAKALKSGQPRYRYGRRLLESKIGGLPGQTAFRSAGILGECDPS